MKKFDVIELDPVKKLPLSEKLVLPDGGIGFTVMGLVVLCGVLNWAAFALFWPATKEAVSAWELTALCKSFWCAKWAR